MFVVIRLKLETYCYVQLCIQIVGFDKISFTGQVMYIEHIVM